ncbi:hypothetical protein [Clostridium sp. YIM B02506]|uniref:hypothetical protein n=1 Tax=Clostridium sp. YIM B02506 TaxID=2910680 RepID=UPI001EEE5D00|nr:hypothetical protein [Clostridium sp. YIM B02506]
MALKSVKKPELGATMASMQQNNITTNYNTQQGGNYDYLRGDGNSSDDEFFKPNDSLAGNMIPLQSLELNFTPEVPEGKYNFGISNLNMERGVDTRYGTKDKIVVDYHLHRNVDGEIEEYHLKQKYNKSSSPSSSFYKVYKDLTGKVPKGKVDLRELLSIIGTCEVEYVELDDGGVFPRIVNINTRRGNNSSV